MAGSQAKVGLMKPENASVAARVHGIMARVDRGNATLQELLAGALSREDVQHAWRLQAENKRCHSRPRRQLMGEAIALSQSPIGSSNGIHPDELDAALYNSLQHRGCPPEQLHVLSLCNLTSKTPIITSSSTMMNLENLLSSNAREIWLESRAKASALKALGVMLTTMDSEQKRSWVTVVKAQVQLAHGQNARRAMRRQLSRQSQSVGLHMLRQVMARLAKGEVAMRLYIWREWQANNAQAKREQEAQARSDAAVSRQSQSTGLRMLRQVMARLAKGEVAMRLYIWREWQANNAQAKREQEAQARSDAAVSRQSQSTGLRMLRQVMARLAKGEVAMRLYIWRGSQTEAWHNAVFTIEQRMRERGQASGARLLRRALLRSAREDASLRFHIWHRRYRTGQVRRNKELKYGWAVEREFLLAKLEKAEEENASLACHSAYLEATIDSRRDTATSRFEKAKYDGRTAQLKHQVAHSNQLKLQVANADAKASQAEASFRNLKSLVAAIKVDERQESQPQHTCVLPNLNPHAADVD